MKDTVFAYILMFVLGAVVMRASEALINHTDERSYGTPQVERVINIDATDRVKFTWETAGMEQVYSHQQFWTRADLAALMTYQKRIGCHATPSYSYQVHADGSDTVGTGSSSVRILSGSAPSLGASK